MVSASSSVPVTLDTHLVEATMVVELLNSKIVTMDSSPSTEQSLALTAQLVIIVHQTERSCILRHASLDRINLAQSRHPVFHAVLIHILFSEPLNAIHAQKVMSAHQLLKSLRSAQLENIDLEHKQPARTVQQATCAIRVQLPLRLQNLNVPMVWSVHHRDIASLSVPQANTTLFVAALPMGIVNGVLLAITAQLALKNNSIVHQDTIARLRHQHLPNAVPATITQLMEDQVVQHLVTAKIVLQATTAQLVLRSPSSALLASSVSSILQIPF